MATTTGAARAQAIVEAARACIAEEGLSGATFERIAARAGVSRGLVHYHFRSKDRLLLAVCRETCHHQTTALGEALSGSDDRATMAERIRELLMQFVEAPTGFRLLSELWTLAGRDRAVRTEVGRLYADQRSALADAIRTGASGGRSALRAEPEAIATTILAVADGLSLQAHLEPDHRIEPALDAALQAAAWLLGQPTTETPEEKP
jgi:AcrR family transcriptional regulator